MTVFLLLHPVCLRNEYHHKHSVHDITLQHFFFQGHLQPISSLTFITCRNLPENMHHIFNSFYLSEIGSVDHYFFAVWGKGFSEIPISLTGKPVQIDEIINDRNIICNIEITLLFVYAMNLKRM